MLARQAVAAVVKMMSANNPTLWLPSYFCPEVVNYCRDYCSMREYRDLPQWDGPDYRSLQPKADDIVLAVNYFGVRQGDAWKQWRERTACVLLEDHSQDPFSEWALSSNADFVFASIRKTLPVADGALLMSPRGLALPDQPDGGDWSGADLKFAAMIYKAEYLRGAGTAAVKAKFRDLQLNGEKLMGKSAISAISPPSFAYLADGAPKAWRERRAENAHYLLARMVKSESVRCMFQAWPQGSSPFVLPILFPSQCERDECQSLLRKSKIYCPVHWVCQTSDVEALALSQRILSLPVDQRYTEGDMDRMSRVILRAKSEDTSSREVGA
jgi:hypothetical protein